MRTLHEMLTKREWFVLFNVLGAAVLLVTGRLNFSTESIVTSLGGLLVMNGLAALSMRNFPEWKWKRRQ